MYAIVEIAGQQFKVEKGQQIFVNRLHEEEGSKVSFDKVLLIGNDGSTKVGAPTVAGASVEATVMQHLKGNKIIVFKKKRRKGKPQCCNTSKATRLSFSRRKEEKDIRLLTVTVSI